LGLEARCHCYGELERRGQIHYYILTPHEHSQTATPQLPQLQDLSLNSSYLAAVVEQPTALKTREKLEQAEGTL